MCKMMEERINEEKLAIAVRMILKGKYAAEEIAEIAGLTVQQVLDAEKEVSSVSL